MPEQAAARLLTLAVERTDDCAEVRCSGRLVAGVNDLLYLEVSQLIPSSRRILLDLTDLTHMEQHGPRHAGSAVRFREIGRLYLAALQHWETDSATAGRYPSLVGIRGDR